MGVAIAILGQINFKPKSILRNKKENYILIKGSSHHEDRSITSIYAPINEAKYMKRTLTELKGEIPSSTIIVGKCYALP